ncbi:MAG: YceI family protein [Dermatophilaceae bacterium]
MSALSELNGVYTIDPVHSELAFVTRHAMVTKVRGTFSDFEGVATTGPDLVEAEISLTIQVASVDTRSLDRDDHLRGADFFVVGTYPTIRFRSTSVTARDDHTLRVVGGLTIKAVTRPITIDFSFSGSAVDPFGNERYGFEGAARVNRKDWGLTWNAALEAGGVLVSEQVTLEFAISLIKTP